MRRHDDHRDTAVDLLSSSTKGKLATESFADGQVAAAKTVNLCSTIDRAACSDVQSQRASSLLQAYH
eukprot:scaffold647920_cov27-Prasinocladus_malaysianus.AAC.1